MVVDSWFVDRVMWCMFSGILMKFSRVGIRFSMSLRFMFVVMFEMFWCY